MSTQLSVPPSLIGSRVRSVTKKFLLSGTLLPESQYNDYGFEGIHEGAYYVTYPDYQSAKHESLTPEASPLATYNRNYGWGVSSYESWTGRKEIFYKGNAFASLGEIVFREYVKRVNLGKKASYLEINTALIGTPWTLFTELVTVLEFDPPGSLDLDSRAPSLYLGTAAPPPPPPRNMCKCDCNTIATIVEDKVFGLDRDIKNHIDQRTIEELKAVNKMLQGMKINLDLQPVIDRLNEVEASLWNGVGG